VNGDLGECGMDPVFAERIFWVLGHGRVSKSTGEFKGNGKESRSTGVMTGVLCALAVGFIY